MKALFTAILFLAMIGSAMAEVRETVASFDYPIVQPISVRLYRVGVASPLCEQPFPIDHTFTCNVLYTPADVAEENGVWVIKENFTMTVIDNQGRETDHSEVAVGIKQIGDLPLLPAPTSTNAVIK